MALAYLEATQRYFDCAASQKALADFVKAGLQPAESKSSGWWPF